MAIAMACSGVGGLNTVPLLRAQAPVGAGFSLDAGDLRFIFRQIQIAQAHSAGGALFGPGPNQVSNLRLPFGLRTVDGSFNHLEPGKTAFGASDHLFPRLTTPVFRPAEPLPIDPDGPGPQEAGQATSYTQLSGFVSDSKPRVISNLIADQTASNPAALVVAAGALPEPLGTLPIPNVATDVGLSAPFNSMFTFFGQFFDHGLDLVNKGGNGTVFVPLQPDDPLFVPGGPNFMMLTRATVNDQHEAINQTTPFVDQNQTYTSHPSHQAFLREYVLDAGGRPRSTGRLIDGAGGNIGNWNEVKAQAAAMLGVGLVDTDVNNVPQLVTDPYGYLIRDAAGFPMAMLADGITTVALTPGVPIPSSLLARTKHEFLNDIAHNAAPQTGLLPDTDNVISVLVSGVVTPPQEAGTYDDELLGAHFVTGDGRGNENIALTAVHTVFHAEHNRLQANIDTLIHAPEIGLTPDEHLAWETTDPASGWDYGERLFQAARFVTEMQYQHLVFEEFARKMVPSINPFIADGINFQSDTNPAIFAEFAHQAYRLGHSMLTETIARSAPDGTKYDIPLLDGFLNPLEFNRGPGGTPLTAAQAAGAIFQGGTRQVGNEIDEFVTEAVRNRLVGLPLDLAVLNIARGRSEGVAPLNEVRRQLFLATGDSAVTPYADWFDFSFALRNIDSLVNFVAAYGKHASLTDPPAPAPPLTLTQRRDAATLLISDPDFLFASAATSGVNDIDLWIGGLAEKINPFGAMLGSTFTFIFEMQLENLQNADRFYYLERLDGLNLLAQLEANSFAEMITRNTTLAGPPADIFSRPDLIFNLSAQNLSGPIVDDPATDYNETQELVRMPNGTIRYVGSAHVIFNGRDDANADRVISSEGDDTLRGNGGNDVMEGGSGNDQHLGGAGDDILTDSFGDDVIKGGPGNDAISGGAGAFDLLQGNDGHDFIVAGNDFSETFGGPGNDIFYTGEAGTESFGGSGDDWIEGGPQLDLLVGDENNQFQDDPRGGHDVIIGGKGDDDYDSEGGDDVMVADVLGTERLEGMLGFDWVTYRGDSLPVDADMRIRVVLAPNLDELRDRFDLTEAVSGYNQNDLLRGTDRLAADMIGHELTEAGINRVEGLSAFLNGATSFTGGDIIMGGAGSDLLEGRGGDDFLDGDAWFNVQLRAPNPATPDPADFKFVNTLHDLKADVFAGLINPGAISIVRSIVTTGALASDVDTALFSGARAEYVVTVNANGTITVDHQGGIDGVDTLRGIERIQFTDIVITVTGGAVGGTAVPNLAGLTEADAVTALTNAGLTVGTISRQNSNTVANGIVLQSDPIAGVTVVAGSVVNLVVSLGPLIPDVHDHTVVNGVPPGFPSAQDALAVSGLVVGTITNVNSVDVQAGLVVTQNPLPGGTIVPGGAVNLFVSIGPVTANTVPVVSGLLEADAVDVILSAGLTIGARTFANSATFAAGTVISTNPVSGTVLTAGSPVALLISLGTEGLVAAFGFNELAGTTAFDSSVVARNGTIRQALHVPGVFGNALSFDGINDWVTVTDITNSPLDLTNGMTIEAWVNPADLNDSRTIMMKERGTSLSYMLYANDDVAPTAPTANIFTGGAIREVRPVPDAPLPLINWTHIATTYDGANQRLYINGVLVGSRAQTGSIAVGNGPLRIGGNNVFGGEFFNGLIDEVRVYNRALSAAEIAADMLRPIQ